MRAHKTATDRHWDARARDEIDGSKVNIADLAQRTVENDFVLAHLLPSDEVLEVGCGNGYSTSEIRRRVSAVDAFDFSESMIVAAKTLHGETNNRFFVHSVLAPSGIDCRYDKVVCVRVLINLSNLSEQKQAVRNFAQWVRPGGSVVLVEGFQDGFNGINAVRQRAGLPPLQPAAINYYSRITELLPAIRENFDILQVWNSGMFDLLTRVAYPLLVGHEEANGPAEFHERVLPLARNIMLEELAPYARLHGFLLKRH
jgi:SAM-dependent methyltransferase